MPFEFGIFHEFPRSLGRTDAGAFARAFAQIDAAERWGIDVAWLAELHLFPERSVASAPLLLASAVSARTRRIESALPSRSCRCATRCGWPRRSRHSITSAADASSSELAAAVFRAHTRPMGYLTARAGSASPRTSTPRSLPGPPSDSPFRGPLPSVSQCHDRPAAAAEASPAAAHCRGQPRYLSGDRRHGPAHFRRRPPRHARGIGSQHRRPTARRTGRPAMPGKARCICACRFTWPRRRPAARADPEQSIIQFYRHARPADRGLPQREPVPVPSSSAPSADKRCRPSAMQMRCATR